MDGPYAAICGISEEEMLTQMDNDVDILAARMGLTRDEVLAKLKDNYDGYHFTWPSPDIYNPFSLLNAFADGKMNSYWFGSGTPTYLIEMLNKYHVIPQQIGDRKALAESFDAPTERITNITPLLYQSGYITIKDYSPITNLYLLDIPNKEVRLGLMKSLLPSYLHQYTMDGLTTVALLYEAIYEKRLDDGLRLLQTFLSTIPYCDNTDYEGHYQSLLYTIFSLLGMYVDVEVRTPRGRVDVVMRSLSALYVIELKLDKSADAAITMNLSTYFLCYWLFSSALTTLLDRFYITRKRLRTHICLWILYSALSCIVLLIFPKGDIRTSAMLVLAACLIVYGLVLTKRLLHIYHRVTRIFKETHADDLGAYIKWLSVFTYWVVTYGVGCGLLTFLPDEYIYIWILSSVPLYIYMFLCYLNYMLFYEQVENAMESEVTAEDDISCGA